MVTNERYHQHPNVKHPWVGKETFLPGNERGCTFNWLLRGTGWVSKLTVSSSKLTAVPAVMVKLNISADTSVTVSRKLWICGHAAVSVSEEKSGTSKLMTGSRYLMSKQSVIILRKIAVLK